MILEAFALDSLPEVPKGVSCSFWQDLVAFYLHPELGTFGSEFSFFGQGNLENFDGFSDCVLDAVFGKSNLFAALGVVAEVEVVVLVEQHAFSDRVDYPFCLVNVSPEKVFGRQWLVDEADLVGEALVELRQDASVLLDQSFQLHFLVVFRSLRWVRYVEYCNTWLA